MTTTRVLVLFCLLALVRRSSAFFRNNRPFAGLSTTSNDEENWLTDLELPDSDGPADGCETVGAVVDDPSSDRHSLLSPLQRHPLLQVPLTFTMGTKTTPIRTFCDTGAQRTVMSWQAASQAGLLSHLDRRYGGQATGMGTVRIVGRIPAGICTWTLYGSLQVPSPAITIVESTGTEGVQVLLGLDFLREYGGVIDLRDEELRLEVQGHECVIPFLRPRGAAASEDDDEALSSDDEEEDDEEGTEESYSGVNFAGV